jgi:hypothetical protein
MKNNMFMAYSATVSSPLHVKETGGFSAMATIDSELAAFDAMRQELENHHMGEWILIHSGKLEGNFESFDAAAENAIERFGRGPYLIRQVGAPPVTLPASVAYFQY